MDFLPSPLLAGLAACLQGLLPGGGVGFFKRNSGQAQGRGPATNGQYWDQHGWLVLSGRYSPGVGHVHLVVTLYLLVC